MYVSNVFDREKWLAPAASDFIQCLPSSGDVLGGGNSDYYTSNNNVRRENKNILNKMIGKNREGRQHTSENHKPILGHFRILNFQQGDIAALVSSPRESITFKASKLLVLWARHACAVHDSCSQMVASPTCCAFKGSDVAHGHLMTKWQWNFVDVLGNHI